MFEQLYQHILSIWQLTGDEYIKANNIGHFRGSEGQ